MELTAQREIDLHEKVGGNLKKIGQPAQTVPENERPVFDAGDLAEVLGNTASSPFQDAIFGKEGLDTTVRVSPGKRFSRWVLDRFRRKEK